MAAARTMSHGGEHALGWLVLGGVGMSASRGARRRDWLRAAESVAAAHAAAVLIKRVIRRPRPDDPRIRVLVDTPSRLSFPSAHVSSTTAAAVAYGPLLAVGPVIPAAVVATMGVSRLVLGVHFPTDVAVGALVGWAVAVKLRQVLA
ncbi:MAG: phosphatase PAP2 family protein [Geodermatophilaceae bacterium]